MCVDVYLGRGRPGGWMLIGQIRLSVERGQVAR